MDKVLSLIHVCAKHMNATLQSAASPWELDTNKIQQRFEALIIIESSEIQYWFNDSIISVINGAVWSFLNDTLQVLPSTVDMGANWGIGSSWKLLLVIIHILLYIYLLYLLSTLEKPNHSDNFCSDQWHDATDHNKTDNPTHFGL